MKVTVVLVKNRYVILDISLWRTIKFTVKKYFCTMDTGTVGCMRHHQLWCFLASNLTPQCFHGDLWRFQSHISLCYTSNFQTIWQLISIKLFSVYNLQYNFPSGIDKLPIFHSVFDSIKTPVGVYRDTTLLPSRWHCTPFLIFLLDVFSMIFNVIFTFLLIATTFGDYSGVKCDPPTRSFKKEKI